MYVRASDESTLNQLAIRCTNTQVTSVARCDVLISRLATVGSKNGSKALNRVSPLLQEVPHGQSRVVQPVGFDMHPL